MERVVPRSNRVAGILNERGFCAEHTRGPRVVCGDRGSAARDKPSVGRRMEWGVPRSNRVAGILNRGFKTVVASNHQVHRRVS
jgi:hypothetical protein